MKRRRRITLAAVIAQNKYAAQNPVAFVLGIASVLIGLENIALPLDLLEQSSIGRTLPLGLEILWAVTMVVGGAGVTVGILLTKRSVEAAGAILLGASLAIDGVVILAYRGYAEGNVSGQILAAAGVGFLLRAVVLIWLSRMLRTIIEDLSP